VAAALETATGEQGRAEAPAVLRAAQAVWASKWNARAWTATRQRTLEHSAITMSVLCQPLLRARLAFVAHTCDPRAAADGPSRTYVEVTSGLGESLVGNSPGSALALTFDPRALCAALAALPPAGRPALACAGAAVAGGRGGGQAPLRAALSALDEASLAALWRAVHVEEGLSKPWVMQALGEGEGGATGVYGGLIARSDSNLEDLGDFAGAGVFESVATRGTQHVPTPRLEGSPLATAHALRTPALLIALACAEVAAVLGGDQDIEGVVDVHGDVHVVQSRPQL